MSNKKGVCRITISLSATFNYDFESNLFVN